jgi:phosphonate metabolism protein PhnN/1,5-bisphosphokinase (PRPP-forming)
MTIAEPIAHSERLLMVVGASGVGKDAVLQAWRHRMHGVPLHIARRTITRALEPYEAHECVDANTFARLQAEGCFAIAWQAHGLHYGIRRSELALLGRGGWVVVNGSRAHLPALRHRAPRLHVIEFVAAHATRAARLASRGREHHQAVQARLARDIPVQADVVIRNDAAIEQAVEQLHRWWLRLGEASQKQSAQPVR